MPLCVYVSVGNSSTHQTVFGGRLLAVEAKRNFMAELLVTYLEMTQRPTHPPCLPPQADLKILREAKLSIAQYLYLQKTVGGPWQWDERLALTEDELDVIIHNPEVDLLVLYCGRVIAGFCEMDRRRFPDIEIKFFGLMPEFIGQGLGSYFLNRAIAAAWEHCPTRLWLHTDTNDHPRALSTYERAGFQVYKQVMENFTVSPLVRLDATQAPS